MCTAMVGVGSKKKLYASVAAIAVALLWAPSGFVTQASAASPAMNVDQLVALHLDSIGSAKVRADLKSRVVQGPVEFKILVGGAGTVGGKGVLVSEGKKIQFMMKLPNNDYRGEQFVFDGNKDKVAYATANQGRSAFGNLVFVQDAILREGLLGGVLSTAWPLLDLDERKPKLSYEGIKTVDGQQVHDLLYRPHKNSDLEIHLYFDTATYRHVETVYRYAIQLGLNGSVAGEASAPGRGSLDNPMGTPGNSSTEVASARQSPTRYRLQEKFSEFKTVDGVTLPTNYDIQFSQELQNGRTTLSDWDLKPLEVSSNVSLDPRNFEVK
jgi:hypothetical protein